MSQEKVQTVIDWPIPSSWKEVQRFLGFANFYWKFITNFSAIAAPLHASSLCIALTQTLSSKIKLFYWGLRTTGCEGGVGGVETRLEGAEQPFMAWRL